jgi:hypothetical protein
MGDAHGLNRKMVSLKLFEIYNIAGTVIRSAEFRNVIRNLGEIAQNSQ